MNFDNTPLIAPLEEFVGFDKLPDFARMGRILRHYEHEWMNKLSSRLLRIDRQFGLRMLMAVDAVFQLHPFELFRCDAIGTEALPRGDRGVLDITVLHRLTEGIIINDVLE